MWRFCFGREGVHARARACVPNSLRLVTKVKHATLLQDGMADMLKGSATALAEVQIHRETSASAVMK